MIFHPLHERNRGVRACVADPFVRAKGPERPMTRSPSLLGRKQQVVSTLENKMILIQIVVNCHDEMDHVRFGHLRRFDQTTATSGLPR
jgi:hypothetical protein